MIPFPIGSCFIVQRCKEGQQFLNRISVTKIYAISDDHMLCSANNRLAKSRYLRVTCHLSVWFISIDS